MTLRALCIGVLLVLSIAGCNRKERTGNDEHFVPYALTGMQVEFCTDSDECSTVGEIRGDYEARDRLKAECQDIAVGEARRRGIESTRWSYVCCTTTVESSCATKVR